VFSLGLTNGAAVTQWDDLSGSGAHATVPSGNASPTFVSNAVPGGLPALYFAKNGGATASGALKFSIDGAVRSIFSVFKGNSFLLTDSRLQASGGSYHFHRTTDDKPTDSLWDNQYASANLKNGSNYVNTLYMPTPALTAMPTNSNNGFNLIETITTGNVTADSFNKDRGTIHAGNQYHAELALFDSAVSEARRLQIEAYLNKKWFGAGAGAGNCFSTNSAVTLYNGSTLDLTSENYQTLASLASTDGLGSKVALGMAALTVGNANTNSFDGAITGLGGSLTKVGSGTLTLAGTNTYGGITTVGEGALRVSGALVGAGAVGVASNATLSGTGRIAGSVTLAAGAVLAPGAADGEVGSLTVGALNAAAGGTVRIDARADGACDAVAVQGAADLSGASLVVSGSTILTPHEAFTVLTCTGTPTPFAYVSAPGGWRVSYREGRAILVSSGTMIIAL
jgi:autotransporter-associated beta strand protein